MRKLALLMACFALVLGQVQAQTNRTITGKVTDEKGSGLGGVTISVQGGTAKTVSATNGTFSIVVPNDAKKLEFSYVGFATYSETIPKSGNITVSLQSSTSDIEGVVITGYTKEKKSQFTGAATTLTAKSIENVPVASFDQNFQGRIPGLLSNSGSGQPGYNTRINIRGISSITAAFAQPLFVIDGVPIASNDLATINADDFESITVLKDAGAAALYGARGGLGVIVITTKKGKAGQTNFSYRTQYGFTQKPNASQFDQMSSRQMIDYEEFVGGFAPALTAPGWVYSKKNPTYATLPAATQARYDFLRDSLANNNANYYDILFRTGKTQSHELTMSGGNAQTRYFLALGYFDQDGVDRKSRLERYTTRFNLDHTVGKFTAQFNASVGFSKTYINEGVFYAGNGTANPFAMIWRAKPYENPYRADGSVIFGTSTATAPKALGNLLDRSDNSLWIDRQLKAIASLTLSYRITNDLSIKNTTGIDAAIESFEGTINANSYTGTLQTYQAGLLNETYRTRMQMINTSGVVFAKKINNRHEVEVGAYFEGIRQWNKGFGFTMYNLDPRLTGTGQSSGTLTTGGAATIAQNGNTASSGYGIRSYFATARYTYNDKYTFNANVRRDGTSRILKDENKEITSWAAGASWNAIKESFMQKQNVLTDLKLRATYGIVPNIGSISSSTYGVGSLYYSIANYLGNQQSAYSTSTAFPGSTLTATVPTIVNADLKIETIRKANIGVDFSFWKNRLRFTVDAYKNVTKDLFVSQPLVSPAGGGTGSIVVNAGTMTNKGFDLVMSVDIVKTRDLDVTIGMNHSINTNNIDDLGVVSEYPSGTGIIRVGVPYGTHYSYNYLGADPTTGKPTYMKQDGVTTTNDIAQAGSFADFGTWMPKHVGGFNLDVRYRRFSVSALFSYQFEVRRYNNIQNWVTQGDLTYTGAVNQNTMLLTNQWQKPGDVKMIQSPAYSRGFTSIDISDAKFLRFRNLSVSYQIPAITVGNLKIKTSSFYIQGQNLAIWSPWSGLDPEDDNNISLAEFPNPRAIVVGLNINF
jgi:TonB-linked SusC/RagA family outer membrane protein